MQMVLSRNAYVVIVQCLVQENVLDHVRLVVVDCVLQVVVLHVIRVVFAIISQAKGSIFK